MSVQRDFTVITTPWQIAEVLDSIGAHVAWKLEGFGSDERTLTDELVDMLCLWAALGPHGSSGMGFQLDLHKVSQTDEAASGADLELVVGSPMGTKRALFQAKVVEPKQNGVRGGTSSLRKLEQQLRDARRSAGQLAFGLFYVPAEELDGTQYGFPTWEQTLNFGNPSNAASRLGTSVIPVDDLLDGVGQYLHNPGLGYLGRGMLHPRALSFTQVLLELIVCQRGRWSAEEADSTTRAESPPARLSLKVEVAVESEEEWDSVQKEARAVLGERFR